MHHPSFAVMGRRASFAAPRRRAALGAWTTDLARALDSSDLARLQSSVEDTLDSVAKAYDAMNQVESDLNELDSRKADVLSTFGNPASAEPDSPAVVAQEPLDVAEANIRVAGKRLAGIDLLYYQMQLVYTDMGNTFAQAGFSQEAGRVRTAAQAMRDWSSAVNSRIYRRLPSAQDYEGQLEGEFNRALADRGLRPVLDTDKPGYFEALKEVLDPLGEEESAVPGLQGAQLGVDPVSTAALIAGIVNVVLIGAVIVGALVVINSIVGKIWGASNEAMKAASELQNRKTLREQEVAAGTLTREDADAANAKDAADTKAEVQDAAASAAKAGPSVTDLLLWVGIPVAGIGAVFAILKISGVI